MNIPIFKEKYKYSRWKAKEYRDEEKLLHKKVSDLHVIVENNPNNKDIILKLQHA